MATHNRLPTSNFNYERKNKRQRNKCGMNATLLWWNTGFIPLSRRWFVLIWLLISGSTVLGQDVEVIAPPDEVLARQIVMEIERHDAGLGIWWTGHNGWLLKADGVLVGTDLVLADPARRENPPPVDLAQVAKLLDVSFVTHGHGDHFNGPTTRYLVSESDCMFVLPVSCLDKAKRLGVPSDRIVTARPRESLDVRGVHVDALRAIHGNKKGAVYYEANLDDCGYVLHLAGKTVLQPGDSVLLEDHLFLKHVDVLLFSPTEHNWLIEDSVTAIQTLEPDVILPQHRDTYPLSERNRFWAQGFPHEVRLRLPTVLRKRYRVLKMGEMLVVE